MTILAIVGMKREARIAKGEGVRVLIGAGSAAHLRNQLTNAIAEHACGVVSFGVAGALSPMLKTGDCVLASAVHAGGKLIRADARWTAALKARLPGAISAEVLGVDSILATATEKRRQFARTGAQAVDTESHIAAALASERKLPFAALRVILDCASDDLPVATLQAVKRDGSTDFLAVLKSVLLRPGQLPLLVRTARNSRHAFRGLARCRQSIGPAMGAPGEISA